MPNHNTVTVYAICPWCQHRFPTQIVSKYKTAVAIPDPLPIYDGFYEHCPKCERNLFIHCSE